MAPSGLYARLCHAFSSFFFDFSRGRPSAILDLFRHIYGPPTESTWGLYDSAKFGYDRCSSFDNMNVSIFSAFGWKTPIHAPKSGVLGAI